MSFSKVWASEGFKSSSSLHSFRVSSIRLKHTTQRNGTVSLEEYRNRNRNRRHTSLAMAMEMRETPAEGHFSQSPNFK